MKPIELIIYTVALKNKFELNTHFNLINNAVESIENNGRVTVSLVQSENYAVISIVDNGHGIPSKILNSLGRRGKTFGKKDGSGLGLYHARKTVESWNGHLKIHSEPRGGTTVSVMLPLAKAAPWFVEHLRVPTNSTIAILDDDVSIHQIWNGRFEKANAKISNVEILHFSTPDQLAIWTKNNKKILATTLFLVDYEFLGFNKVGLEVIEDLEIQSQSILVTSHYEEIDLRKNCERLGVQLIPKDMAAFIPITIESEKKVDAILIDDDSLVHLCWKQGAKEKHKSLASFSTEEEFMRVSSMFAKNTPIYVDVSLANGVRGELVAMRISKIGFSNVYLATGYEPDGFLNLPFIKGVIDKNPPF